MLQIEILKFEAQDIITSSSAKCICANATQSHASDPYGNHYVDGEHCMAKNHSGCFDPDPLPQ